MSALRILLTPFAWLYGLGLVVRHGLYDRGVLQRTRPSVPTIVPFDRQLKVLAKKHPSLKNDHALLLDRLEQDPFHGATLGNACYKVRMAVASKGGGKSGGARVILHVVAHEHLVWLLAIHDKSEVDSIPVVEIKRLLKEIPQ